MKKTRYFRLITMVLGLMISAALLLTGCQKNEPPKPAANASATSTNNQRAAKKEFTVGCMPLNEPAVQIVKELLEARGYKLKIMVFDGNHLPAVALKERNIDSLILNHLPWIQTFNKENKTELTMVEPYTYYSFFAIYSAKYSRVDQLPNQAQIAIGGDPSNMDRSLRVLRDAGLITLSDKTGNFYTLLDVKDNPKRLKLIETEVTATVRSIKDVDAIVTFSSTMKMAGQNPKAYLYQDPSSTQFPTGFVVNKEDVNAEWIKAAVEVTQTQEFKKRFNDYYGGAYKLINDISQ